jgi:hypothetical protein
VNNLGTGFGDKASHSVTRVTFEAASTEPVTVAVIYYDDIDGLKERGIRIRRKKKDKKLPNPFPKDNGCTPPEDWRG